MLLYGLVTGELCQLRHRRVYVTWSRVSWWCRATSRASPQYRRLDNEHQLFTHWPPLLTLQARAAVPEVAFQCGWWLTGWLARCGVGHTARPCSVLEPSLPATRFAELGRVKPFRSIPPPPAKWNFRTVSQCGLPCGAALLVQVSLTQPASMGCLVSRRSHAALVGKAMKKQHLPSYPMKS